MPDLAPSSPIRTDWPLYVIAVEKLIKGVVAFLLGVEALRLVHRDLHAAVAAWAHHLHIAPGNRLLQAFLEKTLHVSPAMLRLLGWGLFLYAALYLVEGVGLALRRRWAEWMVVISTALFVPLEVYEIFHHFTWLRVGVLVANLLILGYLVMRLRRERSKREDTC